MILEEDFVVEMECECPRECFGGAVRLDHRWGTCPTCGGTGRIVYDENIITGAVCLTSANGCD